MSAPRPALPPRFEPHPIEARWQAAWREARCFEAPHRPSGPRFSIPLPPPNVTGSLTMGHMLGDTVQDVLIRWHRMRGEATLWIPGIDHAGLATQAKVSRLLAKEGVRLESLPRAEVIERVDVWKREQERRILDQLQAGGFSVDATRYRYTMDEGFARATRRAFVTLFRDGLVYRGDRIVNWDPKLQTAVSDLEVLPRAERATLLHVLYRWADGGDGGLTVATVRPETIFGDVGVAVHPEDDRYRAVVGRSVRVPLTDRTVPVIADPGVDPAFGSGALKITPRHDALDFEIARRHPELPMPPTVLDPTARLAGPWVPPAFHGLDRDAARRAVADRLRAEGLVVREEAIEHTVGRSERTDAVIEPLLSTQWFVRTSAFAPALRRRVETGEVRLHPERWRLTFFRWIENLQDWCISRQISWGHPIPVYYCDACHTPTAAEEPPTACPKCGEPRLTPDPDVLDTWFTSWMWPFASLGWPEETADLASYFPANVLVTGRDIMFFWVARMMMAAEHFFHRPPFADVYFTGLLVDKQGRKMSKDLGNSPDPLDVVREWGADAMRFALLYPNPVDKDAPFGPTSLEGARNFLTKLWNVARLTLGHLPPDVPAPARPPALGPEAAEEDRWILSRWAATAQEVDRALGAFEFTAAAQALLGFLWHDVADRYVEIAKEALQGKAGEAAQRRTREILLFVLERAIRELHPMVPHVTEELWHALPHEGALLALAPWPVADEVERNPAVEAAMDAVFESVRTLRNLRTENRLPVADRPAAWVRPADPATARSLEAEREKIVRLARLRSLELLVPGDARAPSSAARVTPHGEFFLALPEATDAERETLRRERDKLSDLLLKTRQRLEDPGFRSRAPPPVVREHEEKARELSERLRRIEEHLEPRPAEEAIP